MMAAHDAFSSEDRAKFRRMLKAVVVVTFKHVVICRRHNLLLERSYGTVSRELRASGDMQSVLRQLASINPSDEFETSCAARSFEPNSRNRRTIRYILSELQNQRFSVAVDLNDDSWTVEHVLQVHPRDGGLHVTDHHVATMAPVLGNLTWLERNTNKDIRNAECDVKRAAYLGSASPMTRDLADRNFEWTASRISSRRIALVKVAKTVWCFNAP